MWIHQNLLCLPRVARSVAALLTVFPAIAPPALAAEAARESPPIRLHLAFVQSNPVTTITVGRRTAQAIVDTGGGALTLSKELIDSVGALSLDDTVVSTNSLGREFQHRRFRIPVMTIGGRAFHNLTVIQAPETGGPRIHNGIGRQFLSQYYVVVDYMNRAVTLWPPNTKGPAKLKCGSARIPMEHTEGDDQLVVGDFKAESGDIRLLLDTGATISMLPKTVAEKMGLATYTSGNTTFFHSKTLSAGGNDFGPVEFAVAALKLPGDFEGMLGRNFFQAHVVCRDYRRREVRIH